MEKDEEPRGGKELEVKIYSIATSLTESIIFLDETGGSRIIPIWIGPMEAQAIAIRLSGYPSPRPMTHDLFFSLLKTLGLRVEKVKITDIVDNTYYSFIYVTDKEGKKRFEVDSRPSDAVALAVRFGCPIYISEKVFEKTQVLSKPITEGEVEKFKQELKNLKPNDIISQLLDSRQLRNPGRPRDKNATDSREEEEEEDDEQA
ncbi:MAG: bifunctional nuclease family protein [Elusimicrobia bacterium]|nr:bifunctional nuclease family protein [Elusimicrobiota bacterium]